MQPAQERRRFSDLKYTLAFYQRESRFIEELPLLRTASDNPLIGIGTLEDDTRVYQGAEWSGKRRRLTLKVPVSEACKDNALIKSLYYWERWQSQLLIVASNVHTALSRVRDEMTAERQARRL